MCEDTMDDLVLASAGATRRYMLSIQVDYRKLHFLAHLGEYDLWWDMENLCYTVVQRNRGDREYNFTDYFIEDDGCIVARDDDVDLDPYHMCLLYQVHEIYNPTIPRDVGAEQPKENTE
jgi:hypothetical protein